jgi:hypothetical protein
MRGSLAAAMVPTFNLLTLWHLTALSLVPLLRHVCFEQVAAMAALVRCRWTKDQENLEQPKSCNAHHGLYEARYQV